MEEISRHSGEKEEEELRVTDLSCCVLHVLQSLFKVRFKA